MRNSELHAMLGRYITKETSFLHISNRMLPASDLGFPDLDAMQRGHLNHRPSCGTVAPHKQTSRRQASLWVWKQTNRSSESSESTGEKREREREGGRERERERERVTFQVWAKQTQTTTHNNSNEIDDYFTQY